MCWCIMDAVVRKSPYKETRLYKMRITMTTILANDRVQKRILLINLYISSDSV